MLIDFMRGGSGAPNCTTADHARSDRRTASLVRYKVLRISTAILVALCAATAANAQDSGQSSEQGSGIRETVRASQQHLSKGEACFASGDLECARREFDLATDIVVTSGIDVRGDTGLKMYWRQLVEKIDRYQSSASRGSSAIAWKTQDYEGRPPEDTTAETRIPGLVQETGPLTVQLFHQKFGELQARFHEKFGRDMVITGADHEEHRRLYGAGSAYDIRVKDLSSEEIKFIIDTGRASGLRVKDFSTWDKVQAHNARVFGLGLQSDTLATSVHIHIDRNPEAARNKYVAEPAYARPHKD